jgi:hypothetical protein
MVKDEDGTVIVSLYEEVTKYDVKKVEKDNELVDSTDNTEPSK